MNKTLRAMMALAFVFIIMFSAISICQRLWRSLRIDVTEQKLYTLSKGSRNILARLNQPVHMKLYYAKTATLKAPDHIRFFTDYYFFVRALLEEYVNASNGNVDLQVIDPRPFSDEEAEALQYGLNRLAISEEEGFFFGLVVETELGAIKKIPLFSPERQSFVEYDISYLIDTAITREKKRIGILSSLPIFGDDASGYMGQMMRMQGQQPKASWNVVQHLRQKYEVTNLPPDPQEITDVDLLMVIHPKELPETTLFAIDQFVLAGGRTIIFVDPHCLSDQPPPHMQSSMQMRVSHKTGSDLNRLLNTWGLTMRPEMFAGDRQLAVTAAMQQNQRPQKIIGFLEMTNDCVNQDSAISAPLNQIRMLFAGALEPMVVAPEGEDSEEAESAAKPELTPLVFTTQRGNTWAPESMFELTFGMNADRLMERFFDGSQRVNLAYLITGNLKSSFPDGIELAVVPSDGSGESEDDEPAAEPERRTGLTESSESCAVVVFADVDFISDILAYSRGFLGIGWGIQGDNVALLLNTIEELSGSADLISIRSRGNYQRPFKVIDEIEAQAEADTASKVKEINATIARLSQELQEIVANAKKNEAGLIDASYNEKKKQVELAIFTANRDLREVHLVKRERTEAVRSQLQSLNMFSAPAIILLLAIVLSVRRSVRRRYYAGHTHDSD